MVLYIGSTNPSFITGDTTPTAPSAHIPKSMISSVSTSGGEAAIERCGANLGPSGANQLGPPCGNQRGNLPEGRVVLVLSWRFCNYMQRWIWGPIARDIGQKITPWHLIFNSSFLFIICTMSNHHHRDALRPRVLLLCYIQDVAITVSDMLGCSVLCCSPRFVSNLVVSITVLITYLNRASDDIAQHTEGANSACEPTICSTTSTDAHSVHEAAYTQQIGTIVKMETTITR